jgi:tRNA-dihydrouridine synthase B
MRLGFADASGAEAAAIAKIAQDCGVQAVAVHGRTRAQGYTGKASYEAIGRVKAAVKIPVIGNGDVVDAESALRLRRVAGCDAVMVGRGALGNPWLYRELQAALSGQPLPPKPTLEERKRVVLKHIELERRYNKDAAIGPLRRIICWYFRDFCGAAHFRHQIHSAATIEAMIEVVQGFAELELSTLAEPAGNVAEAEVEVSYD